MKKNDETENGEKVNKSLDFFRRFNGKIGHLGAIFSDSYDLRLLTRYNPVAQVLRHFATSWPKNEASMSCFNHEEGVREVSGSG